MARPSLGQTQSQTQTQVLGARQLQSVEILQLPAADLSTWLREAFEANECLRLEEPERPLPPPERRGPLKREASDRHAEWLANLAGDDHDWREGLEQQLAWLELPQARRAWIALLIERLDEHGLLRDGDEELLAAAREQGLEPDPAELGRAIATLQGFEPLGVGGRDPEEALLLQLAPADPDYEQLCRLIEVYLDDVCRNKLPAVARALGVPLGELQRLLARLGELDLEPLAGEASADAPVVRPDVVALPEAGSLRIDFPRSSIPSVSVEARLADLVRDEQQPSELRRYLKRKVNEARAIVEAVDARAATLERVARRVFEHQGEYLRKGPGHLRPLAMVDLAEELELHVSTISRAVAGKYVQTPWGVEPLRKFFQAAATPAGSGARSAAAPAQATDSMRERVRALIEAEDPSEPLSDDAIAARLAEDGAKVARRTVAKYRRELGLPSSYRRRRFDGA